jgi:hypothetical protein
MSPLPGPDAASVGPGQWRTDRIEDAMPAGFISTALLLTAATGAWAAPVGWQTYRSSEYGFAIDYPADGSFTSGYRAEPQRSMIPICDRTSIACFEYTGHAFDHTVIQSLGVSVNVFRDSRTECNEIDSRPVSTIVIHGTQFQFAKTGSAAAGSSEGGTVYRAFHQHVCFEISLVTAQSDVGPEQYEEMGIHAVDENAQRAVEDEMKRMLQSFVFTGRVRDRAAWNLYHDSRCGGLFEVPAGADVQEQAPVMPPASLNATPTSLTTCEYSFTDHGRAYAITEKIDFHNQEQIDEWLSVSAFPPLAQAKKAGNGVLNYRSSDLAYLVIRGRLAAFSVSAIAPQPPPVRRDPVFTHLVASFRWP